MPRRRLTESCSARFFMRATSSSSNRRRWIARRTMTTSANAPVSSVSGATRISLTPGLDRDPERAEPLLDHHLHLAGCEQRRPSRHGRVVGHEHRDVAVAMVDRTVGGEPDERRAFGTHHGRDFVDRDPADLVDVERPADPTGEAVHDVEIAELLAELAVRLQHVPQGGDGQDGEQSEPRLEHRERNRHRAEHRRDRVEPPARPELTEDPIPEASVVPRDREADERRRDRPDRHQRDHDGDHDIGRVGPDDVEDETEDQQRDHGLDDDQGGVEDQLDAAIPSWEVQDQHRERQPQQHGRHRGEEHQGERERDLGERERHRLTPELDAEHRVLGEAEHDQDHDRRPPCPVVDRGPAIRDQRVHRGCDDQHADDERADLCLWAQAAPGDVLRRLSVRWF
jgi:hypothetical protein